MLSTRKRNSSLGRSALAAGVSLALIWSGTSATAAAPSTTSRDRLVAASRTYLASAAQPDLLHAAADPQLLVAQWYEDSDADADVVPNLVGTAVLVLSDDPTTPEDEQALLAVIAEASGPTVDTHRVSLALDADGDLEADVVTSTPAATPLAEDQEYISRASVRQADGTLVETATEVYWMRMTEGYIALVDARELGLASVRTVVQLDDGTGEPGHTDSAPDAFTGDPIVLPVQPSQPRSARATFGNSSATVRWMAPANPGTSAVRGYKVTASPGSAYCTATTTACIVKGLANGTTYTFTVVAKSAHGTSLPSAPSNAVKPSARALVRVGTVDNGGRLFVNVDPNQGSGYYTFRVQKRVSGVWRTLPTYYRTVGDGETRTLDLGRGTYRVVVLAKYGFVNTYSGSVYLSR